MSALIEGNRITLLCSGGEYFPALEQAIDEARAEVYLETYIYVEDESSRRITDALCRAAGRGVAVHVVVDGFGGKDMPQVLREELHGAGVRLLFFRPDISLRWRKHRLRRMHRKLVAIDGRVGFLGGINLIDDMHTPGHVPPRYDYAVRFEGPVLEPAQAAVERLWTLVAWANLKRRWQVERKAGVDASPKGYQRAQLVLRDNLRHRADIEEAYLGAIGSAREEIIIANAYFFPGTRFRRALAAAAERGVRVILLLQGRVEYVLLHYASRALYGSLLESGVEIFEYQKSFMHAKVAVVDGHWATVGSSNIDPFSLMLAREANLLIEDPGFAGELRASLQQAIEEGAQYLPKRRWFQRSLWERVPVWIGYGLVRLMMGLVGYGGRH